jgi:ankyrin repeat protein
VTIPIAVRARVAVLQTHALLFSDGHTPLTLAINNDKTDVVEYLRSIEAPE